MFNRDHVQELGGGVTDRELTRILAFFMQTPPRVYMTACAFACLNSCDYTTYISLQIAITIANRNKFSSNATQLKRIFNFHNWNATLQS